jgi:hypothetical protein
MTSKIKVDNINKVSDDSTIIKKCGSTTTIGSGSGNTIVVCGSTVTMGRCGGTVALASGATQTGFGRTGTVDWQTGSIKSSATFSASNGEGYFVDTSSNGVTANLPAGSAGAIVSFQDYNNTFDSNALTITPNGSEKINGGIGSLVLDSEGEGLTLVYIDGTVGWRSIHQSVFTDIGTNAEYVAATGGTVLTNGNFKTHIFTGPGTFCVSCAGNADGSNTVDYVVVAAGGGSTGGGCQKGGGGAGGFRLSNSVGCMPAPTMSPLVSPSGLPVGVAGYPVTVGGGSPGGTGSDSVFAGTTTITSAGGGVAPAGAGGSGGGARPNGASGGAGNTPPVSPSQGNNGGTGAYAAPNYGTGGGGGAGGVGGNSGTVAGGGDGGVGSFISDNFFGPTAPSYGTPGPTPNTRYFAGGGGGGAEDAGAKGTGGSGGGGTAVPNGQPTSQPGTVNTGGGGGDANNLSSNTSGGSGIVMIRYKFQ